MAKSAKAKKEKKKDFQKVKLKVGKTKAKADNFTDTSFKARSISLLKQTLSESAPTTTTQFSHHLALLNHKSESQRKESLSNLIKALQTSNALDRPPPAPASAILSKAQPLLLDASSTVRSQTIKLLGELRDGDVRAQAQSLLLFVRAGMTNLSTGVRVSAMECLDWLIGVAPAECVSAPGGWIQTLKTFSIVLGWSDGSEAKTSTHNTGPLAVSTPSGFTTIKSAQQSHGWTQSTATAGKTSEQIVLLSKTLAVLSTFIQAGLLNTTDISASELRHAQAVFPLTHAWKHSSLNHGGSNDAFGYLGLFSDNTREEDDGRVLESVEERRSVFGRRFRDIVMRGIEGLKREGGKIGRAASEADKVVRTAWGDQE